MRHFLSRPQSPQRSLEGFWPCCSKITFLQALPPLSPSPAGQPHPSAETQDSRELHRAPKNPGLHRQRPGFTHTSSSRQTSSPSQMAEKHPTQVGRTGVRPGDTLPFSLTLGGLSPSRAVSPGLGGWATAQTLALGLRRANRPQEGRKEGSLGSVLPSPPVGGCILATHGWCILDHSASSLGSSGAQQRGCGAERGQPGGSLAPQVDHCLPETWDAASAPSGRPGPGSQPPCPRPLPALPLAIPPSAPPTHHPLGCPRALSL